MSALNIQLGGMRHKTLPLKVLPRCHRHHFIRKLSDKWTGGYKVERFKQWGNPGDASFRDYYTKLWMTFQNSAKD